MKIRCASCHVVLKVPSHLKGKAFKCPKCDGQLFIQPSDEDLIVNIKPKSNLPNWLWIAFAPLVLGFLCCGGFGFVALLGDSNKHKDKKSTPITTKPIEKPAIVINAGQLIRDYQNNEVAADQEYKGKILEVNGLVCSIRKFLGTVVVKINNTGDEFDLAINCHLKKNDALASKLRHKQLVTIRGKCDGKSINEIHLKECEIIQRR